jgi:hypothetical protein
MHQAGAPTQVVNGIAEGCGPCAIGGTLYCHGLLIAKGVVMGQAMQTARDTLAYVKTPDLHADAGISIQIETVFV